MTNFLYHIERLPNLIISVHGCHMLNLTVYSSSCWLISYIDSTLDTGKKIYIQAIINPLDSENMAKIISRLETFFQREFANGNIQASGGRFDDLQEL